MIDNKMSSLGSLLLLISIFSHSQTDALRHGFAPRWILEMFCQGKTQIVKLPWNCDGYLHCISSPTEVSGVWLDCAQGLKFDERTTTCVRYPVNCPDAKSVSLQLCPVYKTLRFPHPASCAMYYDCSQTNVLGQFNLGMYENECPYPQLFDPDNGECRSDQPLPVICSNKPASKADYRKELVSSSPQCVGKVDGIYPKPGAPAFSHGYIVCRGGLVVSSETCANGFVFDPVRRQCSPIFTGSINAYCRMNPQDVFPDSLHCGRYYNCSLTNGNFFQNPHQNECLYMYLYDVTTSSCVMYDKLTVPCGTRFEPINPCDYKVGQCMGRTFCIPCEAKCKDKPDGPHPYPTLLNTRFHIMCKEGRTQDVLRCVDGQIYSHQHKLCISVGNPPPPPTTTEPPVNPRVDTVCTCLDEINPLISSLQNLSSIVDAMHLEMQVTNPFNCDEPPLLQNSMMNVGYEFDKAVARYTCVAGYSSCGGQLESTCIKDNIWDTSSLGGCFQNTWNDMNSVILPCEMEMNSTLLFRGRSVEDMFTFSLTNKDTGQTYLYVTVTPTVGSIEAGRTSGTFETVSSPLPLTGVTEWTIGFKPTSFEISVNGHHVISVSNPSPLSLITTFILSDGFKAQEVKYRNNGIQELLGKHPLNLNLALNKPTTSSSTYEQAVPERAVDGYSHVLWRELSCWTASATDTTPWWMVDLGKEFYVSHVVLTSLHCQETCGKGLMNFKIYVFKEDPFKNINTAKEECYVYKGTFPSRGIERIDCGSDIIGQFVKILANGAVTDQMTLCEVEVYGGLMIETGWSPFSCPDPPLVEGASVQLSYTQLEAVATYTCDESDVMCTGNNVIHCSNETGWETPGNCIKTILDAGVSGSLSDFPICRLNLGSGIELWATPTGNTGYLQLTHGTDLILEIALTKAGTNRYVSLNHIGSKPVFPAKNPFLNEKESHIILSAMTDHLLIEVDGEVFFKYPVNLHDVHKANFVVSNEEFRIRKARIYPGFIYDVERESIEDNLALRADVTASSSLSNPASFGVDGNPSQDWPTGSCWNADMGDINQWYQVDLGRQYFIRDINIELISNPGVQKINLHDFTVNVYEENPDTHSNTRAQRCTKHRGEFPQEKATTLTCVDDVWGRYVRIKADDIRDENDQMTICEVEVYGDKVIKKVWSPTDCPDPPMHQNAFVSVAYTLTEAIANYQCFDDYATCNGRNTISCTSPAGWTESPESCLPRTFSAYDPKGLEIVRFCPLRLGEAIEMFMTPQQVDSVLVLAADKDEIFQMTWRTVPRREVVIRTDLTVGDPILVEPVPFEINKESRVVITVLSQALHVDIDGKTLYMKVQSPHLIDTVWTKKAALGKLFMVNTGVIKTSLRPSVDNLAASRLASASSILDTVEAGFAVDGDIASCWSTAANNMEDAWWLVDLENLYYVSSVRIRTRDDCGVDCNRRVHDFMIEMFHRDPEPKDTGDLCLKFDGVLPHASTTTLTCTENVFGRVLRISAPDRKNKEDLFTLCEVQVFGGLVVKAAVGEDPRNLALFRPALSSSENDGVALAGRAVDGNKDIKYISGSCWLAAIGDSDPWWQVELDNYYFISHVEITSRIDCGTTCKNAVRDFVVEVSSQNQNLGIQKQLCLKYDGVFPHSTTRSLKCTNKVPGRFVTISTHGRTDDKDLFTLCEVEVYGEEVTFEETTSTNLAVNRPVSASSRLFPPQWAVDGSKDMDVSGDSCWSAEDGDTTSWWMVELDDYYLVSEVEITGRNDCGTDCNKQLRDFKIELFNKMPEPGNEGDVCLVNEEIFPHSKTEILQCTKKTLGRFVRLTAYGRSPDYRLTICEFGVFGAKVSRADWSPSQCPEPPLLPNACVDISYNKDHAVATYTCNSNYSMCTGSNVLYCNDKGGWEGTPGNCVQTTLEVHHGHVTDLSEFPICYPKLGEGIEMWVTAEKSGCELELLNNHQESVAIRLTIRNDDITIGRPSQPELKDLTVPNKVFVVNKESHVVFLFLTSGTLIKVDGRILVSTSDIPSSPKIYYVRSSRNLLIRMARPVERYMEGIVRVPSDENLAEGATVSASSWLLSHKPENLVDGDLTQFVNTWKCWMADIRDENQWVIIDLGEYYFIRELTLYHRFAQICTICADRTRNFIINVHSSSSEEDVMTCAVYEGVLPLGSVETIRCKEDVWGRYVRIFSVEERDNADLMTFCEIQIYGDRVIKQPWTIYDCPKPILHPDASVHLSYSPDRAFTTYTCNTDYTMCTGSNVLQCTSESGWEGTLGTCLKTTLERNYGRDNDLDKFPICHPKLGEGIELWLFPKENKFKVSLMHGETGRSSLALVISPYVKSLRVTLVTEFEGSVSSEVVVDKFLFTLEREAHVVIVFLTNKLLVLVDGKFLSEYPHHFATPKVSFIRSTPEVNIRMFRPVPRYLDGIVRTALAVNLALNKVTSASSVFDRNKHSNLVDDNTATTTGSLCWHPNVGDEDQWVMIDLDNYYFVRELILYNRGSSAECSGDCAKRTHDFAIDILPNDMVDELTTRCAFYEGIMPAGALEKIRCKEDAWGRYVRISATNVKNNQDLMTFCEVQVYGDAVIDEKYKKCPKTVQVDNGDVSFTGLFPNDVATLTCNANSKPCGSQLTAKCQETAYWEKLTTCDRFRWESPELPFEEALPCGEFAEATFTIKVTPTGNDPFQFTIEKGEDILLFVNVVLTTGNVVFDSRISNKWGPEAPISKSINVGEETTYQIRYSTGAGTYELLLDGTTFHTFNERKSGALPEIFLISGNAVTVALVEILYQN